MDKDVAKRVQNLTDSITFMVFQYTTRGLFECDKLIFTAQMTFQVLLMNKVSKNLLLSTLTPFFRTERIQLTQSNWTFF